MCEEIEVNGRILLAPIESFASHGLQFNDIEIESKDDPVGIHQQYIKQFELENQEFSKENNTNISWTDIYQDPHIVQQWLKKIRFLSMMPYETEIKAGLMALSQNEEVDMMQIYQRFIDTKHIKMQSEFLFHIIAYKKKVRTPDHVSFWEHNINLSFYGTKSVDEWQEFFSMFSAYQNRFLKTVIDKRFVYRADEGHGIYFFTKSGWKYYDERKDCDFHVFVNSMIENLGTAILQYYTYEHTVGYKNFLQHIYLKQSSVGNMKRHIMAHAPRISECDFNCTQSAFIDGEKKLYSHLLVNMEGHSLNINHTPDIKLTKRLSTKYDILVPDSPAVETTLQATSSGKTSIRKLLLSAFATSMNATSPKISFWLYGPKPDSGKSSLQSLNHNALG